MGHIEHNKLVRDNIPEIIAGNGAVANTRTLNDVEYRKRLLEKLVEEAQELLVSDGYLEERADVEEVLRAIDEHLNYGSEAIEAARSKKAEAKGGFNLKIFLESTDSDD